jgi:glycosyltransferase involved in cell wall biosynthesis
MRVALITQAGDNAATRVRVLEYLPGLRDLGHETRLLAWSPSSRLESLRLARRALGLARWADVVVLQKPRQPPKLVDRLVRLNPALVVDFDDAVWTWGPTVAERFAHAVSRARVVIAGSEHLAHRLPSAVGEHADPTDRVRVIPSSVDLRRYTLRPQHRDTRPAVVGWIGTGGSLTDFTPTVVVALRRLVDDGLIRLDIVCNRPLEIEGLPARFTRWSADTEVSSLQAFDIGIMPLPDDERSAGRCGFKAVQCLAVGVPVVASPVGAATEIVDGSTTGLLADSTDAWAAGLRRLALDPVLRQELGQGGRACVARRFSVQSNLPELVRALERARDPSGSGTPGGPPAPA